MAECERWKQQQKSTAIDNWLYDAILCHVLWMRFQISSLSSIQSIDHLHRNPLNIDMRMITLQVSITLQIDVILESIIIIHGAQFNWIKCFSQIFFLVKKSYFYSIDFFRIVDDINRLYRRRLYFHLLVSLIFLNLIQ